MKELVSRVTIRSNVTRYETESLEQWCGEYVRRLHHWNYEESLSGIPERVELDVHVQNFIQATPEQPVYLGEPWTFRTSHMTLGDPSVIMGTPMKLLVERLDVDIELPKIFYHQLGRRLGQMTPLYYRGNYNGRRELDEVFAEETLAAGFTVKTLASAPGTLKERKGTKSRVDAQVRQQAYNRDLAYRQATMARTLRGIHRNLNVGLRADRIIQRTGGISDVSELERLVAFMEKELAYLNTRLAETRGEK